MYVRIVCHVHQHMDDTYRPLTRQTAVQSASLSKCLQSEHCLLAELDDVLAEAQRVSPQVDSYLADSTHSKGKGKKPVSRSNDLEAQ